MCGERTVAERHTDKIEYMTDSNRADAELTAATATAATTAVVIASYCAKGWSCRFFYYYYLGGLAPALEGKAFIVPGAYLPYLSSRS